MATGMAIMGFGGGAMIGSPLADIADETVHEHRPQSAFGRRSSRWPRSTSFHDEWCIRLSSAAPGWQPAGWTPPAAEGARTMITMQHVHLNDAWKTPQFWLIWWVLCLNVTAGIGVIGVASPMLQEVVRRPTDRPRRQVQRPDPGAAQADRRHCGTGFTGLLEPVQHRRPLLWASCPTTSAARDLLHFLRAWHRPVRLAPWSGRPAITSRCS